MNKASPSEDMHEIKGILGNVYSQSCKVVQARSSIWKNQVAMYVAEKPFHAVGIAAVVGIILGFRFRK